MGNHTGNMRESWGSHRGIVGEIGETHIETKVFCNKFEECDLLVPLLSGFSLTPCNFAFIWTSTKPLLKNLNSYCFLQLFQVDIFPSYKNQSESPFSFKLIDCLLYKEIFASNWLWSSSVKQKCLSLCNGGLCDVNSR